MNICYRCRDCGKRGMELKRTPPIIRADICDVCWEQRGTMLRALDEGQVSMTTFKTYQHPKGMSRAARGKRILAASAGEPQTEEKERA